MKSKVENFKKLLREMFERSLNREDVDRERRLKHGYGESEADVDYGDLPESVDLEDETEEEGVSQAKRAAHGYALEDPIDYDVPGEGIPFKESIFENEESEDDKPSKKDPESDEEISIYDLAKAAAGKNEDLEQEAAPKMTFSDVETEPTINKPKSTGFGSMSTSTQRGAVDAPHKQVLGKMGQLNVPQLVGQFADTFRATVKNLPPEKRQQFASQLRGMLPDVVKGFGESIALSLDELASEVCGDDHKKKEE